MPLFELQSEIVLLKMPKNKKNNKVSNVNFSEADIQFSMLTVEISKMNGKYCFVFFPFQET